MAVAKQSSSAATMPNQMAEPAMGAPYCDCWANVSHRNAPGAIRAMAFMVRPVRPNVFFIWGCSGAEAIGNTSLFHGQRVRRFARVSLKRCPMLAKTVPCVCSMPQRASRCKVIQQRLHLVEHGRTQKRRALTMLPQDAYADGCSDLYSC